MAKANTGTTVKKVLLRIKRYWFFLILSILMAAVTVASSLYVPILIGNAIDYIIGPQNVEFKAITAILSEVGIVIAITALSQWIMNICNNKITYHVTRDIRDEAIEKDVYKRQTAAGRSDDGNDIAFADGRIDII